MTRDDARKFLASLCAAYAAAPAGARVVETLARRRTSAAQWALARLLVTFVLHAEALRSSAAGAPPAEAQQPVVGPQIADWDERADTIVGGATALLQPGGHRLALRFLLVETSGRLRLDIFAQSGARMAMLSARRQGGVIVEDGSPAWSGEASRRRVSAPVGGRAPSPSRGALPDLIRDYP